MKFKACLVSGVFLFTSIEPSLSLASTNQQMQNRARLSMGKFNTLWNYSPLYVQKEGKSEVHTKIFKRQMWIEKRPVSLVESSFVYVKNPQGEESANSLSLIAEKINKAFNNKLTLLKNKQGIVLQGKIDSTNRYMVINLQKTSNSFEIATSSIRLGLYKALLPEVNQLHLSLMKYNGNYKDKKEIKVTQSTSSFNSVINWFIKEAHAVEGFNFLNLLGSSNIVVPNTPSTGTTSSLPQTGSLIPGGSSLPTGSTGGLLGAGNLSSSLEGFSNSASSLSSSMISLNDNLTLVNVNWSDSNAQFESLNENLTGLNNTLDKGINLAESFGTKADKALELGDKFNDRASEAINLGKDLSGKVDKGLGIAEDYGKKADRALDIADEYGKKVDKGLEIADEYGKKIDKGLELADKYGADAIKVGNDFNKNLEEANKTIADASKEATRFNDNWAESNKLLARTTDPNHMAKVAFYTAAGAALGGLAINLAIQGAAEGIAFLHELFTHSKQKKMEWNQFQEAMGIWDNQLSELTKLEKLVDGHIAAFDFFSNQNLGNDYNKQLALAMRNMKFDRELFKEKFADPDQSLACRQLFFNASEELNDKLNEFENILKFTKENSTSVLGPNYFCTQLKEMQRRILQAENQMQDVRLKILVAERQFYDKEKEKNKQQMNDIEKVNDNKKGALKDQKKIAEKLDKKMEKINEAARKKWVSDCNAAENEMGKSLKEKFKMERLFVSYFKRKAECKELVKTADLKLYQKDLAKDLGQDLERQIRKDIKVEINDIVNVELSKEQMSWMSRVHIDAYCYQFAHADEANIPAKCKEYPEMLYSLSLAKGYEKAKRAYASKCQERYVSSLDKLINAQN